MQQPWWNCMLHNEEFTSNPEKFENAFSSLE
jgi:hypothetical protein